MMLSDVDGVTPSSDLLVERAAAFDVLSIWNPTSTPVTHITYDTEPGWVPYDTSRTTNHIGCWLFEVVIGIRTPGMRRSPGEASRGLIPNNQFK
jgi:hypothetical protein